MSEIVIEEAVIRGCHWEKNKETSQTLRYTLSIFGLVWSVKERTTTIQEPWLFVGRMMTQVEDVFQTKSSSLLFFSS